LKKISFSIGFDEKKWEAARLYAEKKGAAVEDEVAEFVQKLYEKYVPKDTREYIELAAGRQAERPKSGRQGPHPRRASAVRDDAG
jgi:hypothetical protein